MKVYFLSAKPCALTVNGAYFGITDTFEKFAHLSLKDKLCVCFTPQDALPISFFLTEDILFSPPDGCDVYLCNDALAIYAHAFPARDTLLKIITQNQCENLVVTVFSQGEVQATFQTMDSVMIAYLPPSFRRCDVVFWQDFCLFHSPDCLHIYTKQGECVLQENIEKYHIENDVLYATLPISSALGFIAECAWEIQNGTLTQTQYTLKQTRENADNSALRAYAFFESVRIGAPFAHLLDENLQKKQDKLRGFLGDFTHVTLTDDPAVCGLMYKKAERLYQVRYFRVTLQEDTITDLAPL